MLKKIAIALVVVVAVFLGVVVTRPDTYTIERSRVIPVSTEIVWPLVSDLQKFVTWSPWAKLDPNVKSTFDGPVGAVGQHYHWVGNDQVGEGNMTISAITPPSSVALDLEFLQPFASKAKVTYSVAPDGSGTKATWAMVGDNAFMGKMMSLFMNMDAMLGKDFESGLANLEEQALAAAKSVEEAKAKKAAEEAAAAAAAAAAVPAGDKDD